MSNNIKSKIGIQPLEARVVIKKDDKLEKTSGGIFIPDVVNQKVNTGVVLAVGKGCQYLKVNDKILFDKFAGTEIEIGAETYTLLLEDNVLCIIH